MIIVEGLAGLVRKSYEIGELRGFNVMEKCKRSIFQVADDTFLVGGVRKMCGL